MNDHDEQFVQDLRAKYEALLPKYGALWRSMAPPRQRRQPLSLLSAIENAQTVSLRVNHHQCDCPFGNSCQDCIEPIVEIHDGSSSDDSSGESSAMSQDSAPVAFDLANLGGMDESDGANARTKEDPEPEPFRDTHNTNNASLTSTELSFNRKDDDESQSSSSSSSSSSSGRTEQVGWDLSFLRIDDEDDDISDTKEAETKGNGAIHERNAESKSDDSFSQEQQWLADRAMQKESQSRAIILLDDSDSDLEDNNENSCTASSNNNNKTKRRMEDRKRVVFASDDDFSSEEEFEEGSHTTPTLNNEPRGKTTSSSNRSPTVIVLSDSDDDDDGNDSWCDANDGLDHDEDSPEESIKEKFAKGAPKKTTSLLSYSIPTQKKGTSKAAFRKNRQEIADTAFAEFDRVAFGGALVDVELVWSNKLRTTAGLTRLKQVSGVGKPIKRIATIELSTKIIDEEHRLRATLLHEMCHAAAWLVDGVFKPPHGKCFKKWANIAMRKVPDVIVTTTHDYEISFKYAWACTAPKCGVVIQRHSRSVDVTRHCCGKCKSKLIEIEVPSQKGSNVQHTPRKKAPLSGYNLFVKENSKAVRDRLTRERAGQGGKVSQPEVMKECARLWRERNQDNK